MVIDAVRRQQRRSAIDMRALGQSGPFGLGREIDIALLEREVMVHELGVVVASDGREVPEILVGRQLHFPLQQKRVPRLFGPDACGRAVAAGDFLHDPVERMFHTANDLPGGALQKSVGLDIFDVGRLADPDHFPGQQNHRFGRAPVARGAGLLQDIIGGPGMRGEGLQDGADRVLDRSRQGMVA